MSTLISVGKLITGNARDEIIDDAAILIEGNRIQQILSQATIGRIDSTEHIHAHELVAIPGFVQTHVHLCQTLFRGLAEDFQLLDWLKKRIFPFEAAHDEKSMFCSALLGIAELIRSGTTTILDMGSINHEEEVIRAVGETGMRAFVGKAMMDLNDAFPKLKEPTKVSLRTTLNLAEQWHNSYDGRVQYAVAPRFVLSCTDALLQEAHEMTMSFEGMLFHTHASENKTEVKAVRDRCKMENIEFLDHLHVLSEKACLAHCIHLNDREMDILKTTDSNIAHCPSSNLKLGSGIANISKLVNHGINVTFGADGAPCNNNLNMFQEMRLASLLQKAFQGPTALPAKQVFKMATIGGARALGLEDVIGSIEVGKKADIVLLDLARIWNPVIANEDIYSTIVYSAEPANVDSVMIDGRWVYRKGISVDIDEAKILREAKNELMDLLERVEYQ
ncbi:MAG TPA: 5'-deoxyadenosine deaminase [Bacteroidota bacterium]|nr:5'-deoxyadenosine deaminase [Bacteroidota bacterium]